jgi:hypothetical protein
MTTFANCGHYKQHSFFSYFDSIPYPFQYQVWKHSSTTRLTLHHVILRFTNVKTANASFRTKFVTEAQTAVTEVMKSVARTHALKEVSYVTMEIASLLYFTVTINKIARTGRMKLDVVSI